MQSRPSTEPGLITALQPISVRSPTIAPNFVRPVAIVPSSVVTAAGLVAIACGALWVTARGHGDFYVMFVAALLLGACGGFLWWNRPPARVFMGDTGSQFLGLTLSALSLPGEQVVVNLVAVRHADRPRYFAALLPRIQELRASSRCSVTLSPAAR